MKSLPAGFTHKSKKGLYKWSASLGKPVYSNIDEFPENFRKGGGGHFRSKKFHCVFFCFKYANFGHDFPEKRQKGGGGHFRSENFHCKFGAVWSGLEKNRNIFFRKRGGGGGQRPFGNFPEIHRYLKRRASLSDTWEEWGAGRYCRIKWSKLATL